MDTFLFFCAGICFGLFLGWHAGYASAHKECSKWVRAELEELRRFRIEPRR